MIVADKNPSTRGFDDALVTRIWQSLHGDVPMRARPLLVGLSGLPGSGKSTLAAQLVARARRDGVPATTLALDDFYLGRSARRQLARRVHPLLITRGVPGTHDIALLRDVIAKLPSASVAQPVESPRFDKATDTRLSPKRWHRTTQAPRLIILEGWCVGVGAQTGAGLVRACNRLERDEDADGRWRRWVNDRLADDYARLWRRLDRLVVLQAPAFGYSARWRAEQEHRLAQQRPGAARLIDDSALDGFLQHFERIARHALATLPATADVLVALDRTHEPRDVTIRPARAGSRVGRPP
jgi:D-glycerate 3-kinase